MVERKIPDWARQERLGDMIWVSENLHILWPEARKQFEKEGRGAIVVDTTQQPEPGKGNPFGYVPREEILKGEDKDVERLLREYEPEHEMVVVLLKPDGKASSYRIQVRPPNSTL